MFCVEIRLADEDRLVAMVTAMRAWLDEQEFAPLTFSYSLASARSCSGSISPGRRRQRCSQRLSTALSSASKTRANAVADGGSALG
jgi:hypothetical protein